MLLPAALLFHNQALPLLTSRHKKDNIPRNCAPLFELCENIRETSGRHFFDITQKVRQRPRLNINQIIFVSHGYGEITASFNLQTDLNEYWDISYSFDGYTKENLVDSVMESLMEHRKSCKTMKVAHFCEEPAVENSLSCYS
ncbi:MAG: hypothetical protein ACLU98_04230 [Desulfovibrio fairfieldensis]